MTEVVRAQGTPRERGETIGRAFAGATARSVAFNRRYVETHGLDRATLELILAPYLAASRDALPDLVEQIEGMADGAGQPFLDLFLANAFEEVYGILELGTPSPVPVERCSDVVMATETGPLLGHNEQWYAGDDGAVGLVIDEPEDGPALLAPVIAGTLPLVGMNEHGAAFGVMSLSATDERVGVPRALVARDVLDARDRDDAVTRATREDRAGGYSYLAAFADGDAWVIESTATAAAVLEVDAHTNHALDPAVAAVACPSSPGSRSRLERARALLGSVPASRDGMRALLADHGAGAQDICVHPDPEAGEEASTILFSMICEPATATMWIAPGHPCTAAFEPFTLVEG